MPLGFGRGIARPRSFSGAAARRTGGRGAAGHLACTGSAARAGSRRWRRPTMWRSRRTTTAVRWPPRRRCTWRPACRISSSSTCRCPDAAADREMRAAIVSAGLETPRDGFLELPRGPGPGHRSERSGAGEIPCGVGIFWRSAAPAWRWRRMRRRRAGAAERGCGLRLFLRAARRPGTRRLRRPAIGPEDHRDEGLRRVADAAPPTGRTYSSSWKPTRGWSAGARARWKAKPARPWPASKTSATS